MDGGLPASSRGATTARARSATHCTAAASLRRPMASGDLMQWGRGHKGKWITVYSNPGHAYMKVAGLRFDTSMTKGTGTGWSKQMRSGAGYRKRHKGRF